MLTATFFSVNPTSCSLQLFAGIYVPRSEIRLSMASEVPQNLCLHATFKIRRGYYLCFDFATVSSSNQDILLNNVQKAKINERDRCAKCISGNSTLEQQKLCLELYPNVRQPMNAQQHLQTLVIRITRNSNKDMPTDRRFIYYENSTASKIPVRPVLFSAILIISRVTFLHVGHRYRRSEAWFVQLLHEFSLHPHILGVSSILHHFSSIDCDY